VFPAVPSTTVPPGFNLSSSHRVSSPHGNVIDQKDTPPRSLGILDDPQSSTILYTPTRILELGFSINLAPGLLRQLLKINLGGRHDQPFRQFMTPHEPMVCSQQRR
jgi:hypothetical protein